MKIYVHERLTARGKEQQEKQTNKWRKNIIGLKQLKIKIIFKKERKMEEERKKGKKRKNSTGLQKPNVEAEVCNNNRKCD